jgi:tyrosinase
MHRHVSVAIRENLRLLMAFVALTPFHKNVAGDFWTSNSARNIRDMGYTYPELVNNPSNATLVASIKAQYSGPANVSVTSTKSSRVSKFSGATTKKLYLVDIVLPIGGLDNGVGGSAPYNVLLFLGDVPSDADTWQNSESFVGLASTLGAPKLKASETTSHKVDLSLAIQKVVNSGAVSESEVVEYLKKNLHYRLGLVSRSMQLSYIWLIIVLGQFRDQRESQRSKGVGHQH